jgi:osmotically-inducible protein OsmY
MTLDADLQRDILAEVASESTLNSRGISVLVERGKVTMRGSVSTHAEKVRADHAAHRVVGCKSVALGVSIKQRPSSDEEWVSEVRSSLEHDQNKIPPS